MLSTAINNSAASAARRWREPMAGALADQPVIQAWYMCLRVAKAKQESQSKTSELTKPGSSRNAINSDRQCPMERAVRRCGCVASRCVATQRHSLSRLTEPLWVASAPQERATLSTAPVLFGILRRKRARLATKSQTTLLAPRGGGGTYGDVTRETMSSLFLRLSEVILSPVPLP